MQHLVSYQGPCYNAAALGQADPERYTEIDFLNDLVAAKGEEVGIPASTHATLTAVVKRVELGEIEAQPRNVEKLCHQRR